MKTLPKSTFGLLVIIAAGAVGLISCSGPPAVDAQAVMEDACENSVAMEAADITMEEKLTRRGVEVLNLEINLRVSGQNFHQLAYDTNTAAKGEVIVLDGWVYFREADESGVWGEWVVQKVHGTAPDPSAQEESDPTGTEADLLLQGEPGPTGTVDDAPLPSGPATFCGIPGILDITHLGNATVDDTPVKHLSAHVDPELIGGGDNYDRYEFWVDEGDTLLKAKADIYRDSRGGLPEHRVEYTATYSGHGEPNVITAPEIP